MIVGDKKDILLHDPNLMVIDGSSQQTEEEPVSNYQGSGYLVLFSGRLQREIRISKCMGKGSK